MFRNYEQLMLLANTNPLLPDCGFPLHWLMLHFLLIDTTNGWCFTSCSSAQEDKNASTWIHIVHMLNLPCFKKKKKKKKNLPSGSSWGTLSSSQSLMELKQLSLWHLIER
ncbi:unnamed protein product [Brassica napus]|uniref:(rape) hypothetical protein n=1 Tax=Brassica napus TaxID=3708 RepID=A0A816WIT2_BRANA|nr:unnamed protein product [Brassica napus]